MVSPTLGFAQTDPPTVDSGPVASGLRAGVTLSSTDFVTESDNYKMGLGGDLWIGYESVRGQLGITPLLDLGFTAFLANDHTVAGMPITQSGQLLLAIPSVRFSFLSGSWVPSATVGVGYGHISASADSGGMTTKVSDNFLAVSIGGELDYRITKSLAVGPTIQYKPCFEPALNTFVDFGVNATASF